MHPARQPLACMGLFLEIEDMQEKISVSLRLQARLDD